MPTKYDPQYYANNKDRQRETMRRYYLEKKDERIAKQLDYYYRNKDAINAKRREKRAAVRTPSV